MTTVSIIVIISEPSPQLPPGMNMEVLEDRIRDMVRHFSTFEKDSVPSVSDLTTAFGEGSSSKPVLLWYKIDGYKIDGIHQHMNPNALLLAVKAIKTEMLNITGWNEKQLGVRVELLHSVCV